MMYFYTIVGGHLKLGFNDHNANTLILKDCFLAPGVSIQEMSSRLSSAGKSDYMCGWAFELLRSHPSAIGLGFRRFTTAFQTLLVPEPVDAFKASRIHVRGMI